MTRNETRVQLLMAVVGSFLALAVFTPQLLAEDPLVPEGANYQSFNNDLTWQGSSGPGVVQPGKVCAFQPPCLAMSSFCYTPYYAIFDGTQYQSMNRLDFYAYGVCQVPLPGSNPAPDCIEYPTRVCASVRLWTLHDCAGTSLVKLVFRKNAC